MIESWQALVGISAGAHCVAFGSGLGWEDARRYPAWLSLMLLSFWGILLWDPAEPPGLMWYSLLFLRLAATLEAMYGLADTVPNEARNPLGLLAVSCAWVLLFILTAAYPGGSPMQQYLWLRGMVHTLAAVMGLATLVGLWSAGLSVDRHGLIFTLYMAKFSATQFAGRFITTTEGWILIDGISSVGNVALLLWWSLWVSKSVRGSARERLA